jgi:hypothetical protein
VIAARESLPGASLVLIDAAEQIVVTPVYNVIELFDMMYT